MTLDEQIAKMEAEGRTLLGFYVHTDVYAALCKQMKRDTLGVGSEKIAGIDLLMSPLVRAGTCLMLVETEMVPPGHVVPFFSEPHAAQR